MNTVEVGMSRCSTKNAKSLRMDRLDVSAITPECDRNICGCKGKAAT